MHEKDRHKRLAAVFCAAIVLAGLGMTPGTADAARGDMDLRSCLLVGVNFPDSAERLQDGGWVPPGYPHMPSSPGDATVVVWTFNCAQATVADRASGPARIAVVGAALQYADKAEPTSWPNLLVPADWPGNWGIYVVRVDTDNAKVARWLRDNGMPATFARVSFDEHHDIPPTLGSLADVPDAPVCEHTGPAMGAGHAPPDAVEVPETNKTTTVEVDAASESYGATTSPLVHHNAVTHCHDQLLWYGPHETPYRVRVTIPVARDHFCQDPLPNCGEAQAAESTSVARFLGAERRVDSALAFDHETIDVVHFRAVGA